MSSDLSVVIVSWNVRELLERCLGSLAGSSQAHRVIVVDNASADGTPEMLRERDLGYALNPTNTGFTRANNQGFRLAGIEGIAGGQHPDGAEIQMPRSAGPGDLIFILNPDTELAPDVLAILADDLARHPEAAAVGPALFYPDGEPQPSRRRFPSFLTGLVESTPLSWHWPDLGPIRRYHMADTPDCAGDVDWITGAAMLVRADALSQVGGFDEAFFMYSEELDLCRRLRDAGWSVRYNPAARVVHHEGKSSEQVVARRHRMFQRSRIRYFYKHHGPLVGQILRYAILAQYLAELKLESLKLLLRHKPELRRARIAAYWSLLRDGLSPHALGSPDG